MGLPNAAAAPLAALARPVQHELNNLLTVVFANVDLLRRRVGEGTPARQLERVEAAAQRLDAVIRALLDVLRDTTGVRVGIPARDVVALQPLLRVLLPGPQALTVVAPPAELRAAYDVSALRLGLLACAVATAGEVGGRMRLEMHTQEEALELLCDGPDTLPVPTGATAGRPGRVVWRLPRSE